MTVTTDVETQDADWSDRVTCGNFDSSICETNRRYDLRSKRRHYVCFTMFELIVAAVQ
jgi:hypothetical protein